MTERGAGPLLAAVCGALLAGAGAVFAYAVAHGTGQVDAYQEAAWVLAAVPATAIALVVRPSLLLSVGLALAMFNSHWATLGISVPLDRLALATAVFSILLREYRSGRRLATRPIDWLLMLVGLYAIVSAMLAGTMDDSQARFALIDRFGLLPFGLFFTSALVFREARDREILLVTLVAMGGYLGITALLETVGPRALIVPRYITDPHVGIHYGRARGPFAEADADGLTLFACGVAASIAAALWRDRRARIAAGAVAALCALGVLFTVTRGAWLAAIAGTVVALLAARETRRIFVPVAMATVLGVGGALVVVPGLYQRATHRKNDKQPIYDRRNSNNAALRMMAARPMLGFGWGRFETDSADYYRQSQDYPLSRVRNVHNVFLANAVELGLLGAGLWVFAMIIVFGRAILRRGPPAMRLWQIGLLAVVIDYAVTAMTTPLGYALPTLLLWTWAGICWVDIRGTAA